MGRPKGSKNKNRNPICVHGHNKDIVGRINSGGCAECHSIAQELWNSENALSISIQHKKYYKENRKRILKRSRAYHNTHKDQKRKYYKSHQKEILANKRRYGKEHPELISLRNLETHKKRSLRIPKWGQDGIKEFYLNCPSTKVVDHIIPLQGSKVSGLHVSWNLQYLTPQQNNRKKNSVDLDKVSKQYGRLLRKLGLK
jgi:hypothetical protein